jgi:hypothetical protein
MKYSVILSEHNPQIMKKTGVSIIILIQLLLAGCGRDLDQAKRYTEMKSECDSIIARANLIIKDQKAKADSLRKIRDDGLKVKMPQNKLSRIDNEMINAVTIASNLDMIIKHLEAIKTFAKVGETVNKRLIYYKRTYINYSTTIQVHDENILIQEITDGLSAKQYVSKYLSKTPK